jgi:hypothetical protein
MVAWGTIRKLKPNRSAMRTITENRLLDKLRKANELKAKIEELDEFLKTINPRWNVQRGSGLWDINVVLKTKSHESFSIFGSRWFGLGTRNDEVRIPNTVIDELYQVFQKKRNQLQKTFNELIPATNE